MAAKVQNRTTADGSGRVMDVRNYRAAYSRCVDLAEEWQESDDPEIVECGLTLADMLLIHDGDLEPKHAARPPHPNTMAGR